MPIEFNCPQCQCLLKVADQNAGKRARCPQCSSINRIPAQSANSAAPATQQQTPQAPAPSTPPTAAAASNPQSGQFYIDSVAGQTYGPVSQTELNNWVNQGRVSANCKIRAVGQSAGQPASTYFPSLAGGGAAGQIPQNPSAGLASQTPANPFAAASVQQSYAATSNPYAATAAPTARGLGKGKLTGRINPVEADLGRIFSVAWDVFTKNMGLLLGASTTMAVFGIIGNACRQIVEGGVDPGLGLILSLVSIFLSIFGFFLMIGMTQLCLKLLRGQRASYGDLFGGGRKFFPLIGFYFLLLIIPLGMVFLAGFTGIAALALVAIGIMLLVALSMIVLWPCYSLIVDDKASVIGSFSVGSKIGSKNLLNAIVLFFATFGLVILGCMAVLVGLLFTNAFTAVIWATAYLMMSGQLR